MLPVNLEVGASEFSTSPVSPLTLMTRKLRIEEVPALLNFIHMLTLQGILAFSRVRTGEETLKNKFQMKRNCLVSQFVCWLDSLRHLSSFPQL